MRQFWSKRWFAVFFLSTLILLAPPVAWASGPDGAPSPQADNQACLACHSNPTLSTKLSSGETLSLYIDTGAFNQSVHSQHGQSCTACHTNITGYPHPPMTAKDARGYSLQTYTLCRQCHGDQSQNTIDSIHGQQLAAGNRNAAVCTDCHTAHYVKPANQARSNIPTTCQKCHSAIYDQYKSSVHGAALMDNANPDVPTCTDCHGVHTISDPTTNQFRLNSPQLCAKCHADPALMAKYGISTNVFKTYVADFHGTTNELFAKLSPNQPVNTPVCYDCHGVHDIKKIDDPSSPVFRENLLKTCQQCHPNATANFPAAWMSHYSASATQYPVVYYVNLFYTILIPLTIGGMALFVLLDIARRIRNRSQRTGRA